MQKFKQSIYNVFIDQDNKYTTIYNSFSGGIIKLENNVYSILQGGLFNKNQVKYFNELINGGYIVLDQIDEYKRVIALHENFNLNSNPNTVSYVLVPTLNCNLNCIYCFQKNFLRKETNNIFAQKQVSHIIDFIIHENKDNINLREIKINWFGGEPLLNFDSIVLFHKELSAKLKNKDIIIKTGITTNGILLNEKRLFTLKNICNLEKIQITIDGEEKTYCAKKRTTSDNFYKVLENIRLATKYTRTIVRLNADKTNFQELKRIARLINNEVDKHDNLIFHLAQLRNYTKDENVDDAYFNDYEYWNAKKEFYQNLADNENYKKNLICKLPCFSSKSFCGLAPKQNYVINYNGNLFKCEHQIGNEKLSVGDIKYGIYYNNVYKKAIKSLIDVRCAKCNLFPCCNYAQCSIMHNFTGETKCVMYDNQLLVLQNKVKDYIKFLGLENCNGKQ